MNLNLNLEKSTKAFAEAKTKMPGGVNSPVRSYRDIGFAPPFISHAKGSHIFDIDGNEYIDYVGSWGPMIIGHAHEKVVQALQEAVTRGTSYGAPTLLETELAELVMKFYPSIEMIRMVNSGTEATMSALRLARGFTQREKIVKFIGCYHGHSDGLLVKAGSGAATFGKPDSPGVTKGTASDTITIPYNDAQAIKEVFEKFGEEIAAVIVEPVAGNMGLVLPKENYLQTLRDLTKKFKSLLIFDEVMCGFRVAKGGAAELYKIEPDLICLGKIIGGGLPVAAYGGRLEIMQHISPAGSVYQAGTLSGNPLAMTAGLATLKILWEEKNFTEKLSARTKFLADGIKYLSKIYSIPLQVHQAGSMLGLFFNENDVFDYETAAQSNQEMFRFWFRKMLEQKIYLAPSQFETIFLSSAHTDADLKKTLQAAEKTFKLIAENF